MKSHWRNVVGFPNNTKFVVCSHDFRVKPVVLFSLSESNFSFMNSKKTIWMKHIGN